MTKTVEIYFKSENDAESAHTKLNTLRVNNLYIEEMPDDTDVSMFIPFTSSTIGSSGMSAHVSPISGTAPLLSDELVDNDRESIDGNITHLLRFDVREEDYEDVRQALKAHDCYDHNEW